MIVFVIVLQRLGGKRSARGLFQKPRRTSSLEAAGMVPAASKEMEEMKRSAPVLVLFALLALVSSVSCLAATPATGTVLVTPAASPAASPLPSLEEFLATLSPTAALDRATLSTSSSCTVTGCPAGYKCCYPCGIPDCNWVCMQVRRCPLIP